MKVWVMSVLAVLAVVQMVEGASTRLQLPSESPRSLVQSSIDLVASNLLAYIDQSIGRQARSSFGEIFGISNDDAMKSLFVKILEWIVGLIAEFVFHSKFLN
eukprot:maker-scaffold205_size259573-snap-gene-0.15 protein:Tk01378 transcript:maker-scaffold205_size259573-snap-gene-0.15-mRNA-1 annotation:"phage tail length tape-measure protein"